MDDQEFRQLLNHLDLSWDGYRRVRKGVKKRISRHMQQLGCRTMEAYVLVLDQQGDVRKECERLLTVSISRFFRDRALWHALKNVILPAIIRENGDGVKVLSAGCACGEEVYSLKILWDVVSSHVQPMPLLEIWAVDMNPVYLNKARTGTYCRSSLKEVPETLQARYFSAGRKRQTYTVVEDLKTGIKWTNHDLLQDSFETSFQVVFLRNNVLTYYGQELKDRAFQRVMDSLAPGGFLIIGAHEKVPVGCRGLLSLLSHPCIYQKEGSTDRCAQHE